MEFSLAGIKFDALALTALLCGAVWWIATLQSRVKIVEEWMKKHDGVLVTLGEVVKGLKDVNNSLVRIDSMVFMLVKDHKSE
jgi:hypothetical protein